MASLSLIIDGRPAKVGAREFRDAVTSIKRGGREAVNATEGVAKGMRRVKDQSAGLKRAVAGAFAGLSGALVARQIAQVVSGYELVLATVKGVTGATEEQFARLQATARELGATTRFSAKEAGEGLLFLARAGFTTEQAIAAIPATLNLAAAGALGLGEAADFASNILSQFGLAASETERVADTLVKTANSANTDVRQLAEAMKYAGPVAGALGISVEKTAAAIGVLGDSGIQASLAGTNLRGILAGLLGPTAAGEKAIQRLGLSLRDVDPATQDLIEIFRRFSEANLSAADAVDIFGRRNAAAALILANGVEKVESLTEANKSAAGEAEKLANIMSDTLSGSFKALRSAIEEAFLVTGDSGFAGALRSVTDTATQVVRQLAGVADEGARAHPNIQLLVVGVKALAVALAVVAATKIAAVFASAGAAALALTLRLKALAAAALANPLTALASVAGILAARLATVGQRSDDADASMRRMAERAVQVRSAVSQLRRASHEYTRALQEQNEEEAEALIRSQRQTFLSLADRAIEQGEANPLGLRAARSSQSYKDIIAITRGFLTRQEVVDIARRELVGGTGSGIDRASRATSQLKALEDFRLAIEAANGTKKDVPFSAAQALAVFRAAAERVEQRGVNDKTFSAFPTGFFGLEGIAEQARIAIDAIDQVVRKQRALVVAAGPEGVLGGGDAAEKEARNSLLSRFVELSIRAAEAEKERGDAVSSYLADLRTQLQIEQAVGDEREVLAAMAQLGVKTTDDEAASIRNLVLELLRLRKARDEEAQAQEEARRKREQSIAEEQRRQASIRDLGRSGTAAVQSYLTPPHLRRAEQDIASLGLVGDQAEAARDLARLEEAARRVDQVASSIGRSFSDSFTAIVTGSATVAEGLASLASTVQRVILEEITDVIIGETIAQIVRDLLGATFGLVSSASKAGALLTVGGQTAGAALVASAQTAAVILGGAGVATGAGAGAAAGGGGAASAANAARGYAFENGDIARFMGGGVVRRSTLFGMRNGYGMMGEAGPEAILPLRRGRDGKLGVVADGGGSAPVVNMTVVTQDAGSFARSQRQIAKDLRRSLSQRRG